MNKPKNTPLTTFSNVAVSLKVLHYRGHFLWALLQPGKGPLVLDMTCHPPRLGFCCFWEVCSLSLHPSSWKAQNHPLAPGFYTTGRMKPGLQWFGKGMSCVDTTKGVSDGLRSCTVPAPQAFWEKQGASCAFKPILGHEAK